MTYGERMKQAIEAGYAERGFNASMSDVVEAAVAAFLGDDEVLYQACPNSPKGMYDGNTNCDSCHGLGFVRITELVPLSGGDS